MHSLAAPLFFVAAIALAGCGRIGFDASSGTTIGDAPSDVPGDVNMMAVNRCGAPTTAPASVTFSGTTARVIQFGASLVPEPNVIVTVRSGFNGPLIGSGTSDANGMFSFPLNLGGTPRALSIVGERAGLVTSILLVGYLLDRDLTGYVVPMTDIGGLDSIYGGGGVIRDATRGTAGVQVRDCFENFVAGVAVQASPAPGRLVYTDTDGYPSPPLSLTSVSGGAFVLNMPTGSVSLQLTLAGVTYQTRVTTTVTGESLVIHQFYPSP